MWLLLLGCPVPEDTSSDACAPPEVTWDPPVTTLTERVVADAGLPSPTDYNPGVPDGLAQALQAGLGGWHLEPGETWLVRDELAPGAVPGPTRRSLALFLHNSDAQIADAESPNRMASTDGPGDTQSALRPQELYGLQALDALVRAGNAFHAVAPIDFALATGDNADNVQTNELRWFQSVWDGVPFVPDSGVRDAQLDDDCNDPLAPMYPVGADFPWYAVAGNHDVLVQGNFEPGFWAPKALGSDASLGTRDLSDPGGPIGFWVPADDERAVLARSDIAAVLLESPATPGPVGHGFTEANVTDDTVGWVASPVDGVPLTVIAVDANPDGPNDGQLSITERDTWLVPQLEAAQTRGDLIVVTSHYALGSTSVEGGGTVGDLLLGYPNVVLVAAGHWHTNEIRAWGPPDDPAGFWEIVTASTADWPAQGRLVELVDNSDGTLSIVTTVYDVPAPEGSMAARFRTLSAVDLQSGWRSSDGTGDPQDRNVELLQRLPATWSTTTGRAGVRSLALP